MITRDQMTDLIRQHLPEDGATITLPSGQSITLVPTGDDEVEIIAFGYTPPLFTIYEYFLRLPQVEQGKGERSTLTPKRRSRTQSVEQKDASATSPHEAVNQECSDQPPREISTAEAAEILGVSKDTVLSLKDSGLLEYRNTAPPGSSRPIYAFSLRSVMELRTSYQRDEPCLLNEVNHRDAKRREKGHINT